MIRRFFIFIKTDNNNLCKEFAPKTVINSMTFRSRCAPAFSHFWAKTIFFTIWFKWSAFHVKWCIFRIPPENLMISNEWNVKQSKWNVYLHERRPARSPPLHRSVSISINIWMCECIKCVIFVRCASLTQQNQFSTHFCFRERKNSSKMSSTQFRITFFSFSLFHSLSQSQFIYSNWDFLYL